jgi:hypothetical protein
VLGTGTVLAGRAVFGPGQICAVPGPAQRALARLENYIPYDADVLPARRLDINNVAGSGDRRPSRTAPLRRLYTDMQVKRTAS